jgi:tetratricopeptide (TPR) repeat protein
MAVDNSEYDTGRLFAEEALTIHREHGDAWGIARSVFMLGYAAIESGDFASAKPLFEETVRLMAELGYEQYVGMATFNLAWAYGELGDRERAKQLAIENLGRARAIGSPTLESATLASLGFHAHEEGRYDEALEMQRESLRVRLDLGDAHHILDSLFSIASTYARMAGGPIAAELLSASVALYERAGLTMPLYAERENEKTLVLLHEQLDEAAFEEAWEQGQKLTIDEAVALALGD